MCKILFVALLIVFGGSTGSVFAQGGYQDTITGTLTYDYSSGHLLLNNKKPLGRLLGSKGGRNRSPHLRIFGLYEGQGVRVAITNINPLKYTAEVSGSYQTITTAPPDLSSVNMDDYFKGLGTPESDAGLKDAKEEISPPAANWQPNARTPDKDIMKGMREHIACIENSIAQVEERKLVAKEIAEIFQGFNNYYDQLKNTDRIDEVILRTRLGEIVVQPLHALINKHPFLGQNVAMVTDITIQRIMAIRERLTEDIDSAAARMDNCYDELYDLLLGNRLERLELIKEKKNEPAENKTALMLLNLPETKKDFYKIRDWAKDIRETVSHKIWPDINKSVSAFIFCLDLRFDISAGTFMADEDLTTLAITVRNIADNKEVRKIDRIKFQTYGGFRMEYGIGFYFTALGNDEFVIDRNVKIGRMPVLNGTSIDTVLQNVNYSTLKKANGKNLSWGTMSFFQGRTNLVGGINAGAYVGVGLLLNAEARPIFSAGGSLVIGRIPRGNLNIGVVWGRVDRINPKYELNKEYMGDIDDPTISSIHSRLLIGFTWSIGKVKG